MNTSEKNGGSVFRPSQNAAGISENHHTGINRLVKLSLVIEGKVIKYYKHFKLTQSSQKHHEFTLTLAHDTLGDRQTHTLEEANKFLGKRLTAVIAYKDIENSPERTFVGVITGVGFSQEKMSLGNIVLSGYSPTILLDGAPHIQSFGGNQAVNMGIIAEEVIKQGLDKSRFDIRIDTNDYSQIIYSSQYDETHYNYLARMAEAYGEQFYYDGEVLHFGKLPPQNQAIKLTYGSSANDIKVELKAVHTKPQFYGYNSNKNEVLKSGSTPIQHVGDLAKTAYQHNDAIYKTPSLRIAPIKATTHLDVEYSQKSTSGSEAVNVFNLSGSTTVPFLHPGCSVDIEMRKVDTNETSYFTRIMVTETTHEIDTIGHYTGSFAGIASDTGFLPKPEFTVPIAQPQIATVISNTDPEGQGRVQVRFDWQTNDTTHFIRMMSPDAGGTDQITQNRGYVAIPEVGDQVMVNFVHNHPDRPFVMGGMFHGGTALGGFADNRVKSIMTRSGHKVVFTEDESIIITDKSGNEIHLDTTGSNINITAPETMTLNCKNMFINVSENMTTSVGMDQSDTIGMNRTQSIGLNATQSVGAMKMTSVIGDTSMFITGKLTEIIEGDVHSETKKERNELSHEDIQFTSEKNITKNAQSEVKNNSGEVSKNH
ncbi:phage baseplate assembly protein V [Chryseobacterium sp. Ch-15]|uniref:Phage baseplate assembly protein V n=1 Tax=Chryseobacterium muglaense TaxID=2893752 RepID=A0A9Q3UXF2_9FLAO|nr:phage baseplate assembly protein V [Chryseobacterium muglaense]MBD3907340.1 Vgr family protein [Chryseobacterium muglaense]MCC9036347.1 phage baseplate assembly protein V [Chryseobacterium muglaense]MCM2556442.1 phage baseplate assembly protein V [Chryseobacterium muglaense]